MSKTTLHTHGWALLAALFSTSIILADCHYNGEKISLWNGETCLRGANVWQKVIEPEWDGDSLGPGHVGPPFSQKDLSELSRWGANYVNFSLPGTFTEQPPYVLDPLVLQNLDDMLAKARAANLFVVISLRTGPGRNEAGFDSSEKHRSNHRVWSDQKAQDAWVAMWQQLAERYRDFPHVVGYDLMVEPNSNWVLFEEWDSETFNQKYAGTLADWTPLAQRITRAIRAVDAKTPILIGAMNYCDGAWLSRLNSIQGNNLVHLVHQYQPYDYTHSQKNFRYPGYVTQDGERFYLDKTWLAKLMDPAAEHSESSRTPLAINEYGVMRWMSGAPTFLRDSTDVFEASGMNHAIWLWEPEFPLGYDEFNYRMGINRKNHKVVTTNDALITGLKKIWSRNIARPFK